MRTVAAQISRKTFHVIGRDHAESGFLAAATAPSQAAPSFTNNLL